MLRLVIFVSCLLQLNFAQILYSGSCSRSIRTIERFDSSRYLGRWYEQQKYPFVFELAGKCIYAEYGLKDNGAISVYNYYKNEFTRQSSGITGSAQIVGSGKLKVEFNNIPSFLGPADYWILATDYENYAVVYSCSNVLGFLNAQVVWILTRKRYPSKRFIQKARSVIAKHGLSLSPLRQTKQTGC